MSKMSDLDVDIQENGGTGLQAVLRDLARAKVTFQQRSILAAMDVKPEDVTSLPSKGSGGIK